MDPLRLLHSNSSSLPLPKHLFLQKMAQSSRGVDAASIHWNRGFYPFGANNYLGIEIHNQRGPQGAVLLAAVTSEILAEVLRFAVLRLHVQT